MQGSDVDIESNIWGLKEEKKEFKPVVEWLSKKHSIEFHAARQKSQ
jgi:hypothetical protein